MVCEWTSIKCTSESMLMIMSVLDSGCIHHWQYRSSNLTVIISHLLMPRSVLSEFKGCNFEWETWFFWDEEVPMTLFVIWLMMKAFIFAAFFSKEQAS